jgi:hypothetical protein
VPATEQKDTKLIIASLTVMETLLVTDKPVDVLEKNSYLLQE